MEKISDLRLSKNMKYTALYTAMRFFETEEDIFEKKYKDSTLIKINSITQSVYINNIKVFELNTHESFVKLECINRILSLGYSINDFKLIKKNNEIKFKKYKIKFIVWDESLEDKDLKNKNVIYKSRLVSGLLEYKNKIVDNGVFEHGLFEIKNSINLRQKIKSQYNNSNFIIEENRIIKYIGKEKIVNVPYGIQELESCSFWDNQFIEEVILPETLINMGGDTFYNCKNLKKINIPSSVELMGNNPFAGCLNIEITNNSKNFLYENNILYTADKKTIIYCSIKGREKELVINEGIVVISKHAFFLCDRFEKITLPSTLKKMENNPFSGCSKLELINNSNEYFIKDDVIYNKFKTAVVGTLNKIKTKKLELLNSIKSINRNSFWNCKGIEKIVLPESLCDIGYNPFVGCSNIIFESKTPYYKVLDGVLYNADMTKIICYPAWKKDKEVNILESVNILERGAFSGCENINKINLHNVNIINKSCFTNCLSLKEIYFSDLITYIGEWAFAYCKNLRKISIKEGTIIDNNAFSNCNAKVCIRKTFSNYLFESDNIFTLIGMQKAYKEKIDSILIDPPYNSNIDYIGYKDGNYEEGYYNFILKRIKLAYKLLSKKGFLIVNIDKGEVIGMSKLLKKIFGKHLVYIHKWKKINPYFDTNRKVNFNKKIVENEYIIICKKSRKSRLKKIMQPFLENNKLNEYERNIPKIFDFFGTTSSAKDEIGEIFGNRDFFSTPKPIKLMKELIRSTTSQNSIILDFFAGSGTVGHACLELNSEDNGNRKYILISNKESNICENVTKKRLEIASKNNNDSFIFMK